MNPVSKYVACIRWQPYLPIPDQFCAHGQRAHGQLYVWLIGMANRKPMICSTCEPCYAN